MLMSTSDYMRYVDRTFVLPPLHVQAADHPTCHYGKNPNFVSDFGVGLEQSGRAISQKDFGFCDRKSVSR